MASLDTNVLVRYLTQDDEQSPLLTFDENASKLADNQLLA